VTLKFQFETKLNTRLTAKTKVLVSNQT